MTVKDINNIISIICPNDEDFEKPIISPKYLKEELEQLALEQEPNYKSFCEFVAKIVMEEDFELNAGANAEIFCRKLADLGIVKADGDDWMLK